jgi:hypothetical protein
MRQHFPVFFVREMRMPLGRTCAAAVGLIGAILAAPQVAPAQPFADEHIRGTVESFDGQEQLMLRDERGFLDDVAIGHDTRITPRGTRLVPGMRIAITGYNGGRWFDAVSIQVLQSSPSSTLPSYAAPAPAPAETLPPPADVAIPPYSDPGPVQSDLTQRGEPVILRATWVPYPVAIDAYPFSAYPPRGTGSPPSSGSPPRRNPRMRGVSQPAPGH